ncbi:MAG: hypothetical protein ABJC61_11360 [Acidobacteriota bacterium]
MPRGILAGLCLAGVAARVWYARKSLHSTDMAAYQEVLALIRGGRDVYEGTPHYNYPPLWLWTIRCLGHAALAMDVSFPALVRSLLIGIDAGVAAVLFHLARRVPGAVAPWTAAAAWLANPMVIWVCSVQAQFDGIVLLFLLLALAAGASPPSREEGPRWSAVLALAASIGFKQVTAFHPILWFEGRRRLRALVPWLLVALTFAPYAAHARAILDHVLLYRTVPGSYGLAELVLWDARWALPVSLAALAGTAAAAWALRGKERCRSSLFLFLVLLVLAPGFGSQYLVWPLAVGALFGGPLLWVTTSAGLFWTLAVNRWISVSGAAQFGGQILWLCLILWGVREARALNLFAQSPRAGGNDA